FTAPLPRHSRLVVQRKVHFKRIIDHDISWAGVLTSPRRQVNGGVNSGVRMVRRGYSALSHILLAFQQKALHTRGTLLDLHPEKLFLQLIVVHVQVYLTFR